MGHAHRRSTPIRVRVMRTEDEHGNVSCFVDSTGRLDCKHVLAIRKVDREMVAVAEPLDDAHRWPTIEEYRTVRANGGLQS